MESASLTVRYQLVESAVSSCLVTTLHVLMPCRGFKVSTNLHSLNHTLQKQPVMAQVESYTLNRNAGSDGPASAAAQAHG